MRGDDRQPDGMFSYVSRDTLYSAEAPAPRDASARRRRAPGDVAPLPGCVREGLLCRFL